MSAERVGITKAKARKISELILEYDKRRAQMQELTERVNESDSQLKEAIDQWLDIVHQLEALGVDMDTPEGLTPPGTAQPNLLDSLPAHVQRAFQHVQANPGITAYNAAKVIKNKRALYYLAKLGLIDKRGSAFFPKDELAKGSHPDD